MAVNHTHSLLLPTGALAVTTGCMIYCLGLLKAAGSALSCAQFMPPSSFCALMCAGSSASCILGPLCKGVHGSGKFPKYTNTVLQCFQTEWEVEACTLRSPPRLPLVFCTPRTITLTSERFSLRSLPTGLLLVPEPRPRRFVPRLADPWLLRLLAIMSSRDILRGSLPVPSPMALVSLRFLIV